MSVKHFHYKVHNTIIPRVDILHPDADLGGLPVKKMYGFTIAHAFSRALRWMSQHGDPR